MKKALIHILIKLTKLDETIQNLVAENNNLKRRIRDLEGLNTFNRRY